jgi:hypothetical protein
MEAGGGGATEVALTEVAARPVASLKAAASSDCSLHSPRSNTATSRPGAHHADAVAHGHQFAQVARHHQQRAAGVGHAVELGVEVGARAHVHAARGLVEQQHLAFAVQPAREHHLLLVAAAERGHRLFDAARADAQQVHQLRCNAALLGGLQPARVRHGAQVAQRGVDADRLRQQQALRLAVFGDQPDAGADRLHRRAPALAHAVRGPCRSRTA